MSGWMIVRESTCPTLHAHISYMVKHLKIIFSRAEEALGLNLDILHQRSKVYKVCSNDCRRLTFDLFTTRSILRPDIFVCGKF